MSCIRCWFGPGRWKTWAALMVSSLPLMAASPTDAWLRFYALQRWQAVLDQDADGFSADEEFTHGTDPLNALSRPPRFVLGADGFSFEIQVLPGASFGSADLQTSTDLRSWTPVLGFPPATPGRFTVAPEPDDTARFFRIGTSGLADSDGDCLLDFEELKLFHTDPLKTDTDGDGLDDCAEVNVYRTDPNHGSLTGRGAIRGRVVLEADSEPATEHHPGLAGWTVFADLDQDGARGASEPAAVSQADGSYILTELDPALYRVCLEPQPAWVQVFPALTPLASPDGYPDRVVALHDSGKGPLPFPYGRDVDPLPGLRLVFPIPPVVPVSAANILGVLPHSPIAGPYGGWWHVDVVVVPEDSWLTVAFDGEEIVDGPGPDLTVVSAQGGGVSKAELYLGSTTSNLTSAGVISQTEVVAVDLATLHVPQPVRYLKLRALDLLGAYPGWDLVGFEALNFRPQSRGHYEVTVVGNETVTEVDFGVAGQDRPPTLFISTDRTDITAGQLFLAEVIASDDLGIASVTLTANGLPVPLDNGLKGSVSVTSGGLLELAATATDTGNQEVRTLSALIARNADGTLPDLSGLAAGDASGAGGPSIRVASPVAGEILSAARAITASITGTTDGVATWQVHYAPADSVNPLALDAPDPDYVLLGGGTGPVVNGNLGTLPGDVLAAGAYLLRISAADLRGATRYLGFVLGVNVDPLDIRPAITLTAPTHESTVTYLTELRGSITTRQTLREWSVEFAPLSRVNLQNLSDPTPVWTRLASGTTPATNALLATFDPTLLPNDSYVLRVSAWNQNGLGWAEPVVVHVTSGAKLGNFAVQFTDVEVPLAGIPITIKRGYDSLNAARSGDFGHGWSLAVQDADIAETVPQTGSGLISTPFRVGTRVYLNAPDGPRIGFTFQPEIGAVSFLGAAYAATFKPDPGVRYSLSVPQGESAFLTLNASGEAALFFLPLPWNPDTYILTDKQGTRYTYDQRDGLIEIADRNDNRVTFSEQAIAHSAGPRVELTRDAAGRITRILAPDGRIWRYQYSAQGDLVQVTYPGERTATFGYAPDRPHFLEGIHDPTRGPVQRTEYDANGRVAAVIDAQGNRREQHWDPGSFSGTYTDARGNLTRLTYDARGNLTRREDPLGGVTTWEYRNASFPQLETAMTSPSGARTTYSHDARGNLLQVNQDLRRRVTYTYDDNNRVASTTYGTGGQEALEYDARGNLVRYDPGFPLGSWAITHTATGLPASVLDNEGGLTRIEYDGGLGLPNRILAPDGGVKHFGYDASGRVTQYTDPLGGMTRFEYDSAGRLVRQVDPAGGEVRITYDTVFPQQPATITQRDGRATSYAYDALGRVQQVTAPGGALTRFEYDADGNRTAVVDPAGNRYEFKYDAMNRLVEETDPLGKKRLHDYDLAGNRTASVDRNGRRRSFVHDRSNRLTHERWHDPADDRVVRTNSFTYDNLDRLTSASDPDATLHWAWLPLPGGPVATERATYGELPERRVDSSFDAAGRRSELRASSGILGAWALGFTRDTTGRLRIVTSRPEVSKTVLGNAWQLQLWRNPRGDVTSLRRFADAQGSQPVSESFLDYSDPCGCRLDGIRHVVATNQPLPGAAMTFTRDLEGAITAIQEGGDSLAFGYDAAAQLTRVIRNGVVSETYAYDLNGNRIASHRHSTYATGPGNRLTKAGPWALGYDDEGNLITKSNAVTGVAFSFTWDHRNRLTQVRRDEAGSPAASEVTEYRYDTLDRRIAVARGGQTTWTYYDGHQPLMDYLNDETLPDALYYAGERLDEHHVVWRRGQGMFWTLSDHLGSVRRVLQGTNGVEVAALQYDSYGNLQTAAGSQPDAAGRFGFAGREWDAATDLHFNRARYYDPELGRFISEDPRGFLAGDMNLYRYVHNNPLNLKDPFGLSEASESGVLNLPSQIAKEAICEAGAEIASVFLSAALPSVGDILSAAVDVGASTACGAGGPTKGPKLTPDEIRLNKVLEELPPFRYIDADDELAAQSMEKFLKRLLQK